MAGGSHADSTGSHILVNWPRVGRGKANERIVSKSEIVDLAPLSDGRLVIGAANLSWSLFDQYLNEKAGATGELIGAEQIDEIFRRPDLVRHALGSDYPKLARKTLVEIGDVGKLLAQNRPPKIKRSGPAKIRQDGSRFEARFQVTNRGGG